MVGGSILTREEMNTIHIYFLSSDNKISGVEFRYLTYGILTLGSFISYRVPVVFIPIPVVLTGTSGYTVKLKQSNHT